MASPNKMPVHCGVNTCTYWDDNFCTAKSIEVNNMANKAYTSDETCCETFICKD